MQKKVQGLGALNPRCISHGPQRSDSRRSTRAKYRNRAKYGLCAHSWDSGPTELTFPEQVPRWLSDSLCMHRIPRVSQVRRMRCSRSATGKRPAAEQKSDLKVTWIASRIVISILNGFEPSARVFDPGNLNDTMAVKEPAAKFLVSDASA